MRTEGQEVHVSEEEASGGSKEGVVRWVLIIGTLLAIAGLSFVWITGSATHGPASDANQAEADAARSSAAESAAPSTSTATTPATGTEDKTTVENGLPVVKNT